MSLSNREIISISSFSPPILGSFRENFYVFMNTNVLVFKKGHTMPLSSVTVGMTRPSDGIQLSASYQTLCSVSPGENINIETRWYISIPSAQYPGTYTFTWYVTITSA